LGRDSGGDEWNNADDKNAGQKSGPKNSVHIFVSLKERPYSTEATFDKGEHPASRVVPITARQRGRAPFYCVANAQEMRRPEIVET
jgi:hypothetical protein